MTDNRTTELRISKPLLGFIKHQSNRGYIDAGQAQWLFNIADEIDAKHEQAIAATLGSGECELICHGVELPDELKDADVEICVYECSECGERMFSDYNFCPNCGAKMKGGVEQ